VKILRGDHRLARPLGVALALLLPAVAWWLRRFPEAPGELFHPCLMQRVAGLPCPTCGTTRALVALAHGQTPAALAASPLATLTVLGLGLWALAALVLTAAPRLRRRVEASPGEGRRLLVVAAILLVANWLWLLRG
jgi:hypothetical protein